MGLLHHALYHRRRRYRTRRTVTVEVSYPTAPTQPPAPRTIGAPPAGWADVTRVEVHDADGGCEVVTVRPEGTDRFHYQVSAGRMLAWMGPWLGRFEIDQAAGTAVKRRGT